ncbi:response regulator [Anaerobacillus sp. 1_MG-2023]|uniref:response regulator transcription factor n=1 Tax=Bacillales TaxID=1385 RepID=UPI0026E350C0|nr:response regulator [Anaerobacillus sp. 1_MG-2023]MDO6657049.1 response regulator [Anaerobacillus sp. 1_MG-2023]
MNLKVLIVDDEPIICEGLKNTVPWDEMGAEVIGEAYDGEEALEVIEAHDVDVVLSDVKMPIMDGLELAGEVYKRYPSIRMIIISGYDEFEYAKQAMKLGIKDYLLKPVDIDELMELIISIRKETEHLKKQEWESGAKQILSSLATGQELSYLPGSVKTAISGGIQLVGSEIQHFSNVVNNCSSLEEIELKKQWMKELSKAMSERGIRNVSIVVGENSLLTCCGGASFSEHKSLLEQTSRKLGFSLNLTISHEAKTADTLQRQYYLLNEAMKAQAFHSDEVLEVEAVLHQVNIPFSLEPFEKDVKQLHSEEEYEDFSVRLLQTFKQNRWYLENIVRSLEDFEKKIFKEFYPEINVNLYGKLNVGVHNSYEQLGKLFYQDLIAYGAYQETTANAGSRWLIRKAVSYIEENYGHDLKASEVADVINVSPNYFSQLFKRETDLHFNDYLHEIRIGEAKVLLKETPYRVFEIAQMVGYHDYKYFVHNFKKVSSMTPTQYRSIIFQKSKAHGERNGL